REPGVDERRVLARADAPRERVVAAAHARVAVGRLDELARLDHPLARDLVADTRADAVLRGEGEDARVPLERALHLAQLLDLAHEGPHPRDLVGVDEVVLEDGELRRIRDAVVRTVLLREELVDLRRR